MRSPHLAVQEVTESPPPLSLHIPKWELFLSHKDSRFAGYILKGLRGGFRLGFSWSSHLAPAKRNIPYAPLQQEAAVDAYVLGAGNSVGPLPTQRLSNGQPAEQEQCHNTGKWRIITDLSFPDGSSVIDSRWCSLEYTSVDISDVPIPILVSVSVLF